MTGYFLVMCKHPDGWYPSMLPSPTTTKEVAEARAADYRRHNKYPVKVVSAHAAAFADELVDRVRQLLARAVSDDPNDHYSESFHADFAALRATLLEIDAA